MRFVQTATGHRVLTAGGHAIRKEFPATVRGLTPKGYCVLVVPEATAAFFSEVDREIRRKLATAGGPWNAAHRTLAVKLPRGCSIVVGGRPGGCREDLLPHREVVAGLKVAGAWPGGYVWQAETLTLGGVPEFVGGV